MKGLKQTTRNAIAYIAANLADRRFTSRDLPSEFRLCMSGLVSKDFLTSTRYPNTSLRIYTITPGGLYYARHYAQTEMESYQ